MQNEEFSKRGHEKARVRSADAAVKKAVEHEAALERKTAKKPDLPLSTLNRQTQRTFPRVQSVSAPKSFTASRKGTRV